MKSPLLRAFSVPDVHPRPRKRLARCTLDCGFKTPESPALRGFVAERGPITGTSLYLVLKSNGLHRPKIRLKKFSFSLKIVPAYISKKLPSQCWPKPLFIAFFNFSHKWPTFAFVHESGYTLAFAQRIAHSGSQGETGAVSDGALLLPSERSARSQTSPGRVSERCTLPLLGLGRGCSRRTQRACGAAMRLCASLLRRRRGPAGLRNLFRFCRNCGLYALRSGSFRVCKIGGGITTLGVLCVLPKRWMAACQSGSFAVF